MEDLYVQNKVIFTEASSGSCAGCVPHPIILLSFSNWTNYL